MKQKFNKAEIMRRAHYIRSHSFVVPTMSKALKQAWEEAKRRAEEDEKHRKYMSSFKRTKADERNAQLYKNVVFGKNDWDVSYGRKYRYF